VTTLFWVLLAFISGALPFSVWVGRLALRTDIRRYGDHNPGATNVLRAGSKGWAGLALFLDMMKGAVPVGAAWFFGGLAGWSLALVALAPVLGHAWSPFLGFKGGKAIAVTGGVWAGLTVGWGVLVLALLLVFWHLIIKPDGWAVLLTLLAFLPLLLLLAPQLALLAFWAGSSLVLAIKHRAGLAQRPHFKQRVSR
jgi:glycerol-3-phosphate acyltransferase PlsY